MKLMKICAVPLYPLLLWKTLIGAIPMVTMTQSATNWRNTHTHMGQHSYNHVVRQLSYNPPNSDMDYRIFIVRTWSFVCVRVHTGVGHTDSESAQHFWLGKTHKFFLCSQRDSNLRPLDPNPTLYQLSHPVHTDDLCKCFGCGCRRVVCNDFSLCTGTSQEGQKKGYCDILITEGKSHWNKKIA